MADRTDERAVSRRRSRRRKKREIDYSFFIMIIALLSFGLIMVFSASSPRAHYNNSDAFYFVKKQAVFALAGLFFMWFVSKIHYKFWYKTFWVLGVATFGLLGAVALVGTTGGGAQRWLAIGPVTIQPSEIAKFTMVAMTARLLTDYQDNIGEYFKGMCAMMALPVVICGIVLLERHLSGAIIILLVGAVMVYVGGAKAKHILTTGVVAGAPVLALAILLEPYRVRRVMNFWNPFLDMKDSGYQMVQSLYAIGSGGLFGVGLGQSREKYLYLPEAHTDFIYSVICEELGFVGAILVIVMFAILVVKGFRIAMNAPDRFSSLLVTGIVSLIGMQALMNIAVVTASMPCTGITLPFFSYGGTSLVINLFEMGVVLNVSRYSAEKNKL